jgi:hypothetical protein
MARSYFSRILPGARSPALAPARPVSNLWKSVRIDSTLAAASPEIPAQAPDRGSRRRAAAAADPEAAPAISRRFEIQPKPEPPTAAPASPRQAPTSSPPFQKAAGPAPREEHVVRPADGPLNSKAASTRYAGEREPATSDVPRAALKNDVARKPDQAVTNGPEPAPGQRPAISPKEPRRDLRPPQAHVRAVPAEPDTKLQAPPRAVSVQPGGQPVQRSEPSAAWNPPPREEPPAAAAPPQARIQPARNREPDAAASAPQQQEPTAAAATLAPARIEPVRHREPAAGWNAPSRAESGVAASNAVHIGKIEVQVVTPPAPVRYAAPAAPPKGRLARGYALWSTWQ